MANYCSVDRAIELLISGGIVALPTETVYGLGADATNEQAVAKIFEAKNRPAFDPLIVHVPNIDAVKEIAELDPRAESLLLAFSPGPLTVVLKKKSIIPDLVTSGHSTVAVRIPAHPVMLDILNRSQLYIAAPSANPFGYTSPTMAEHVADQLGDKVDGIVDGGPCQVGVESTIIDLSTEQPRVLRLGGMALEQLELVLAGTVPVQTSSSMPNAPGMLSAHYNPGTKVVLCESIDQIPAELASKTAVLGFGDMPKIHSNQYNLSPTGDYNEAARNLFKMLRTLGKSYACIYALKLPEISLGRAVNDRLKRASVTS